MPGMDDALVFDRRAVRLHRDRAAATVGQVGDVLRDAAERLLDRLDDTTRRFTRALDVGGRGAVAPLLRARGIEAVSCDLSPRMAALNGPPCVAADEEALPFAPDSFDLVVASLSLHWINDLPGALIQLRRAMRPDGLLLASLPALGTLAELRAALLEAEGALQGGAPGSAQRLDPMVPIELVAAEVEQHQDLGTAVGDQVGDHPLVGLQHRDVGRWKLAQRRRDAVVQVGAVGVGHQPGRVGAQPGANRGGQQVGGGGLAVRARHARHPAAPQQQLERIRGEPGQHLAADRGTGATVGNPGPERSDVAGTQCGVQPNPVGKTQVGRCCATAERFGGHGAYSAGSGVWGGTDT